MACYIMSLLAMHCLAPVSLTYCLHVYCRHLCCCFHKRTPHCAHPTNTGKAAFDVAVSCVDKGLSLIQRIAQAHIDVQIEPVQLQELHNWLQAVQAEVEPLLSLRLRSVAASAAVQNLLDTTKAALAELDKHAPDITGNVPGWKQVVKTLCRCITGPSKLARFRTVWVEQLRNALQRVKDAGSLQQQICSEVNLPHPCVVNTAAYAALKELLEDAARSQVGMSPSIPAAATADTPERAVTAPASAAAAADAPAAPTAEVPGQPCVVQLLGGAGMGKSTLALKLAQELDRPGECAISTVLW